MSISLPVSHSPDANGNTVPPEQPSQPILLQVGDRAITANDIIPLLSSYRLLPQLLRELLIDQAIAPITCTFEETIAACKQFYEQNQITSEDERQAWLVRNQLTLEQLESLVTRNLRTEKYKAATWGNKLESYFLQRKGQLDRVIYSLIRTKELGIAQELYFRLQAGEQQFADLAREYSQGPEAQTGGLIGPVDLSVPHPALARQLTVSQPGQLLQPTRLGEWIVIVRLEKLLPAQLDDAMRQRLLNELFDAWVREEVKKNTSMPQAG